MAATVNIPSPMASTFDQLPSSSRAGTGPSTSTANSSNRLGEDDEALQEIRRYEDFSTVDWIVDSTRERNRLARERQAATAHFTNGHTAAWGDSGFGRAGIPPRWWPRGTWGRGSWLVWGIVKSALSAFTDSGVVVLVGIIIGLNMGMISLATEWASDLKQGYCASGWWLNQKFCCWEMMDPAGPGGAPIPAAAKIAAQTHANLTLASSDIDSASNALNPRWAAVGLAAKLLVPRADTPPATPAFDMSETCTEWIPWSRWTFPAYLVYVLFAALLAATCAHLVRSFAPYAAGSGISEIKCILAGFVINGYLGAWTLAIKSLTLPLAIASGLSVGKEGPAVHVACCIGNVVAGFFRSFNRSQAKMRELLTAASAAGVAVAFGSPIGGVLFSLEEMAYNFPASTMWRSFLCALAATVTLSFMNPFRTGKLVLFQVSYDRDWHYFEIFFYIIIGIFGGLYGAFVIKYNLQVQSFRRNHLAKYGVSEAVILAALTAIIGYGNKFLRIDMTESLEILFRECEGGGDYDNLCQRWAQWRMVNSLLLATVLRIIFVIISYGCKVPAGIFVPSMAIGATFGRMVGILVKALQQTFPDASFFSACQPDVPCITPGTYAFLGAAAALAGVTRITVAVVVIMFELTGALTYILPTMIVVGITKGVGDWYGKGGIAEQMIKFSGYPFLDKDEHAFGIPVRDVMKVDPLVLTADGLPLAELETKLNTDTYKGFPVVRSADDNTLLGYVGKVELRYALAKARRARHLERSTMCRFTLGDAGSPADTTEAFEQQNGPREEEALLPDEEAHAGVDGEGEQDSIELAGWVDQTPLIVQPGMPLEVVMDLFKTMGPRVILVARYGRLAGLVTVKDVLKRIAAEEARAAQRAPEESGELEVLLAEAWDWARGRMPYLDTIVPRRPRPPTRQQSYTAVPLEERERNARKDGDEESQFVLGEE